MVAMMHVRSKVREIDQMLYRENRYIGLYLYGGIERVSCGVVKFIDYNLVPIKLWVPHGVFRVDGYIMSYVMKGWNSFSAWVLSSPSCVSK